MFLLYIKRNIFFTQWLYGYVKVTLKLSCKDIPGSMISRESSIEMRKKKQKKKPANLRDRDSFRACAAFWFLVWRAFFQDWLLVKKSFFIDPEMPEKAFISVFKSYLVYFGSFKCHILYFKASIVEKIRSHWGEVHEGILFVVSVPTSGSNVAFNVVIWLSFLFIKFSSQRSAFFG